MQTIQTIEGLRAVLDTIRCEELLKAAMTAELNAEVARISGRFLPKIEEKEQEIIKLTEIVEAYAVLNRGDLLSGQAKSAEVGGHRLGWRENGGAIVFAKGQNGKKVLERLRKAGGSLRKLFIRETPALNKDAMKAKWLTWGRKLQAVGVRLKSEEIFFVEIDVSKKEAK